MRSLYTIFSIRLSDCTSKIDNTVDKAATKNAVEVTLRLSSDIIDTNETNFLCNLL